MNEMKEDLQNFRIKVDLSQFYNDERKLSYVYIDKVKVTKVLHLQLRIQNIFGIIKPLYLIVNGGFLPANEDIRIIKEDEVVVVQSSCVGSKNATSNVCDAVVQTQEINGTKRELVNSCEQYETDSADPEISDSKKAHISITDIQSVDLNFNESENSKKKRKRIRCRKRKNKTPVSTSPPNIIPNNRSNIITDGSNSKHLKFVSDDSDENEKQCNGVTNNSSSKLSIRSTEVNSLETLLSLRNSKVPLTFYGQRRTRTNSDVSTLSINSVNNKNTSTKIPTSINSTNCSPVSSNVDYSKINISEYPVYDKPFEVNDVIAFQTLILNDNYCPVLSDYILAKIISKDLMTNSYSCNILVGRNQLKIPEGKFAMSVDDDGGELNNKQFDKQELLTLKHSDLTQPRLIHRSSLD